MSKLWFKARNYGWGWRPVTWQGWVVTLIFILLIGYNSFRIDSASATEAEIRGVLIQNVLFVTVLLIVCYITGERPEWRWNGKPLREKLTKK